MQKKSPDRVNIHLDGEYAFGLARIVAAWLKVGQELSEEKIEQLLAADARERAYQQAMLFLSYRARSETEIRRNLRRHEIPEAVIDQTIERLRQDGLANDRQLVTPFHLAGLGDLITTATSRGSHHHELGRLIVRGERERLAGEGVHTLAMLRTQALFDSGRYPLLRLIDDCVREPRDVRARLDLYLQPASLD